MILIEGVNLGMSDANALKEELAEVVDFLKNPGRYTAIKNLFLQCLVLPRGNFLRWE